MSLETFKKSIELTSNYGDSIEIGGGEPTIHPLFDKFLLLSIAADSECVWISTNGSITQRAIAIAKLARKNIISAQLSRTQFHMEFTIDHQVEQEFNKLHFGVVDYIREPIKGGRCKQGREDCYCKSTFIKPNGDIFQCGCVDSPKIGNVLEKNIELNITNECYKTQELSLCQTE